VDLALRTETFGNQRHSWLGSEAGTRSTKTGTLAIAAFTQNVHYANGYLLDGLALAKPTSGTYVDKLVPMASIVTEQQTVTITGTPTGGTVTLTLDGETTAAIAYNAAASAVQTALEGLSNVSPGDVAVTGGPGPGTPWIVTFGTGTKWAGKNVPQMTASGGSLTGGTSPAIAVTTTTGGGSGVTDGSDALWGFLYMPVTVPTGATDVYGPVLLTGQIIASKLPVALSATQKATNPHFVWL
jgi:hypothetical protein